MLPGSGGGDRPRGGIAARRKTGKQVQDMFRIFTDNGSNLPQELIDRYNLGMIGLHCYANNEELDFSRGFDGSKYYGAIREGMQVSTAMPSMGEFLDAFTGVLEGGEDLLYVGISGGISGTASLAAGVVQELQEQFPERKIAAIDTRGASLGEGFPAVYAARLCEQGLSFETVAAMTEQYCDNMWQVFTVDDLAYLRKTGRLFSAAVKVTNTLNVKPILVGDEDGHIVLRKVTIGRRRSLDAVAARYREKCADKTAPVGLAHADCEEDARYVIGKLREAGCTGEITLVMYDPVTGSHVGPGTVALFFRGEGRP